jgi:hypothetical protein
MEQLRRYAVVGLAGLALYHAGVRFIRALDDLG